MNRPKIGFVTGLKAEAALLHGSGFLFAAGGGFPEGAYRAAMELVAQGAQALISFGLAGGLAPGLVAGTVLIPKSVVEGPHAYPCDFDLMESLGGTTGETITAGSNIASTADAKAAIFHTTQAAAIDLESGAVARAAAASGLPFAVLRAIADPAGRGLPPAALVPLKNNGGIDLARILCSVARHPGQIAQLLALARDAAAARAALVAWLKTLD